MHALIKCLIAAFVFGGGFVTSQFTQDDKKQDAKPEMAMQGQEPTEWHKWLAEGAGKWKAQGKISMGDQTVPMSGVQTNTMQQGGLWQIVDYKDDAGQFVGHGVSGYDVVKKKFVSVWVDSMNAELSPAEGTLSADKKTLTMKLSMTDPESGKKVDVTETIVRKDKDTALFEMTHTKDGKSAKVLEITYTRM